MKFFKHIFLIASRPNYRIEIALPDAMIVKGAGTDEVNAVYLRDGEWIGNPIYTEFGKITTTDSIYREGGIDEFWTITNNGNQLYNAYVDVPTPDLVDDWSDFMEGDPPAPTVDYATWADIDAAGIDRASVPLLD